MTHFDIQLDPTDEKRGTVLTDVYDQLNQLPSSNMFKPQTGGTRPLLSMQLEKSVDGVPWPRSKSAGMANDVLLWLCPDIDFSRRLVVSLLTAFFWDGWGYHHFWIPFAKISYNIGMTTLWLTLESMGGRQLAPLSSGSLRTAAHLKDIPCHC